MGPTRPLFLSSREPFATTGVFQTKKVWIPSPFWTRRSVREVLSSSVPCRSSGLAPLVASRRQKLSPRSEEELPVYRQLTSKTSSSPSSATTAASASPALRSVNSTMTTPPLPPNPVPMHATTRTTVPIAPALSPTRTRKPSASSSPENPESRTETSSDSPFKPLSLVAISKKFGTFDSILCNSRCRNRCVATLYLLGTFDSILPQGVILIY